MREWHEVSKIQCMVHDMPYMANVKQNTQQTK